MLKAGVNKEMIADFLGLTLRKLEEYILEIHQDENPPEFQQGL